MATPPTFQAEYEASTWDTVTTPKSVTPTTAAGDVLAIFGGNENGQFDVLNTPTGNSLTYSLAQSVTGASLAAAYVWTAPDATGGAGWTLQVTATGGVKWGFSSLRFSGSDGVGGSAKAGPVSGAPSLAITTQQDNSAIVVFVADFGAVDGTTRTWRTVNGITPTAGNGLETTYFRNAANYTVYAAYYSDTGAAGSKTVGLSAPGGQTYSIVAVEIKGTAGGAAAVDGTVGLNPRWLIDRGLWRPIVGGTEAAAAGPSASGTATDTDRTSGLTMGVHGGIGATSGGTRVSGLTTGIKNAIGASSGPQRTTGTTAVAKQATGATQGQQHSSGTTVAVKDGIGATAGQQRSSGVAVKGTPPAAAALGYQRVSGTTTGIKNATASTVTGQTRLSGVTLGIHRSVGVATGQLHSAGSTVVIKRAAGSATGQQRTDGLVAKFAPVIDANGRVVVTQTVVSTVDAGSAASGQAGVFQTVASNVAGSSATGGSTSVDPTADGRAEVG